MAERSLERDWVDEIAERACPHDNPCHMISESMCSCGALTYQRDVAAEIRALVDAKLEEGRKSSCACVGAYLRPREAGDLAVEIGIAVGSHKMGRG